jgi:hypothetical protein
MVSIYVQILLALQLFVVLFIALHDWIPLGNLNDPKAVREVDTTCKLLIVTTYSTLPFAIGFVASVVYARSGFPHWLLMLLWISYGTAIYGMLRTWWIPYLFVADPVRARRYQSMFGSTHAFLPIRNGIRPNTLHIMLHLVLIAIVVLLVFVSH